MQTRLLMFYYIICIFFKMNVSCKIKCKQLYGQNLKINNFFNKKKYQKIIMKFYFKMTENYKRKIMILLEAA